MTKTANKKAIKSLPALRASLIWYKRNTVRSLRRRAADVSSPAMRTTLANKASKVAHMDLADLRASYLSERVSEICSARLFELALVVPGLVRLRAIRSMAST